MSQLMDSAAFLQADAVKGKISIPSWGQPTVKTVNVPASEYYKPGFCIQVSKNDLANRSVFGAVMGTAIPRTQGTATDLYRLVLLDFAKGYGKIHIAPAASEADTTRPLAEVVNGLRKRSGLPAAEVARMVGIQRRQLYYLAEGGNTGTQRERRIRSVAQLVDHLHERFGDPAMVRSALLAPIGRDLRSFVDLTTEGGSVRDATHALEDYLAERSDGFRQYVQTPRRAREHEQLAAKAIAETRDIAPTIE